MGHTFKCFIVVLIQGQQEYLPQEPRRQHEGVENDPNLVPVRMVGASQRICFVCGSRNGRVRLTKVVKASAWAFKEIYIPPDNRLCKDHINGSYLSPEAIYLMYQR